MADDSTDADAVELEREIKERARQKTIWLEGDSRALRDRNAAQFKPPSLAFDSLEEELAQPEEEINWTVDSLHEAGTNTIVTGGSKAGKSTFMFNLIRSLADSEPFLGEYKMRELSGRIAYFNFELTNELVRRGLRAMGIRNPALVDHLPLRGEPFDIMNDAATEWTVAHLKEREVEVWIIDPFSGIYHGEENSNTEQSQLTKRLDQIKAEAGVPDLFMPVHTGHGDKERARGASKIEDWADNRWRRFREAGQVWFKNDHGRGVSVEERVTYLDQATNLLSYGPHGTRATSTGNRIRADILNYVAAHPGCNYSAIVKKKNIIGNVNEIDKERQWLIDDHQLEIRDGSNNQTFHYIYGTAPTP